MATSRGEYSAQVLFCYLKIVHVLTFRKCQRVVPLVELADGVESAVARLQEIGGAALHHDTDVRRFGVAQFFDGFHLEHDVINFLEP